MKLALFLLLSDVEEFEDALRDTFSTYSEVDTRSVEGVELKLYIRRAPSRPPRWLKDLRTLTDEDLAQRLTNQFSSAILLIRRGERRFILTWGQAFHVVDRAKIEPGFGLKVTANAISADGLLSADTRGLGRARSQRTIMPTASRLYELGIEPSEEWVRQLTGTARIQDFAGRVSGADSLKLSIREFSLIDIPDKLDEILKQFESTDYRQHFDFLDYFSRVGREQKALLNTLWSNIQERVDRKSDDLDFAAPELLEPFDVSYFNLSIAGSDSCQLADLTRDGVYGCLTRFGSVLVPLDSVWVDAFDSSDGRVGESYRLQDYVVAEADYGGKRYTVSAGAWFSIDTNYVEAVTARIRNIPELGLMPPWVTGEDEGDYNVRVAEAEGWVLLDKKNFYIGGPYQKVEICDLLTAERQLICVKRMDGSSTLSHLFAQGAVSAQLLMVEDDYRKAVVENLQKIAPGLNFENATAWTVVYGIATSKPGPLADSLYFFSKVNLDRSLKALRSTGVNVALARIEKEAD